MQELKKAEGTDRSEAAKAFAIEAARLAANTRCHEVTVLDVRGLCPVADFFVIASGTSARQMRTVVDELRDLGKKMGFQAWRMDGYDSARWIVLDCVGLVAHLFDQDSRDFSYLSNGEYKTISGMTRFVRTDGGLFVFLPSITALRFLATGSIPAS